MDTELPLRLEQVGVSGGGIDCRIELRYQRVVLAAPVGVSSDQ